MQQAVSSSGASFCVPDHQRGSDVSMLQLINHMCTFQGLADMKKTPDMISPNMTAGVVQG